MELTFLASGKGEHQERRPDSPTNPSRGTLSSLLPPSVLGGHPGSNAELTEQLRLQTSTAEAASTTTTPGYRVEQAGVDLVFVKKY